MTHCRYFLLREKDGETGPASPGLRAAAPPKPASIFIDNPTGDPQAKTSTILTFCGEEWLKNSPPILSRNTRSVVCNENTDAAPCRVSPIPGSYNVQLECSFRGQDRKSTRLNSSHSQISYAVFCLKKTSPLFAAEQSPPPERAVTAEIYDDSFAYP